MINLLRAYLNLGTVATVAAVVGVGTALYSANQSYEHGDDGAGGGGSTGPGGAAMGAADQSWQQLLQRMMSEYGTSADQQSPMLHGAFDDASSRVPGMQDQLRDFARMLTGQGGSLFGAGDELRGAGRSIWDAARDPQNALRDRTQQRIVDASRAGTSARGIGMSGDSAGIENQAVGNFNIDWNNQQLQRLLSGGQGMAGMFEQGGRNTQAGGAMLQGAAGMDRSAMALPFDLSQLFSGAVNSSIYGPATGIMGQIDPYIRLGQSGQQNSFNQGQTNMNNIYSGLTRFGQSPGGSWLTNFFSGNGGSAGAGAGGDGSGSYDFGGG